MDDAPGRALPRDSQWLAGHDRIFLVGPHVELLNFAPVLWVIGTRYHVATQKNGSTVVPAYHRVAPRLNSHPDFRQNPTDKRMRAAVGIVGYADWPALGDRPVTAASTNSVLK